MMKHNHIYLIPHIYPNPFFILINGREYVIFRDTYLFPRTCM
ncbi:hypothetical protein HanRHA438_Chr09g0381591 [Helianthus annuus]|nr:hypothetical protein HanRHA438_Chr09g0381591 [Helianthus annuus]